MIAFMEGSHSGNHLNLAHNHAMQEYRSVVENVSTQSMEETHVRVRLFKNKPVRFRNVQLMQSLVNGLYMKFAQRDVDLVYRHGQEHALYLNMEERLATHFRKLEPVKLRNARLIA
jgi:hypothetical protein